MLAILRAHLAPPDAYGLDGAIPGTRFGDRVEEDLAVCVHDVASGVGRVPDADEAPRASRSHSLRVPSEKGCAIVRRIRALLNGKPPSSFKAGGPQATPFPWPTPPCELPRTAARTAIFDPRPDEGHVPAVHVQPVERPRLGPARGRRVTPRMPPSLPRQLPLAQQPVHPILPLRRAPSRPPAPARFRPKPPISVLPPYLDRVQATDTMRSCRATLRHCIAICSKHRACP